MFLRSDVDLLVSQCRLNVRGIRGYIRNFTGCIRCGEAFATNLFDDLNYRVKHHMTLESPSFSDFISDELLHYAARTLSVHRCRLQKSVSLQGQMFMWVSRYLDDIEP